MADTITALLARRRGHFQMESGYHSAAWFELGSLFEHPDELAPVVTELARRVSSHRIDAVCGPMTGGAKLARLIATELRIECFEAERLETPGATGLFPVKYELPDTQRQKARGRSVAIVDDAISAGSAVRGTYADLVAFGARPVVLGALIVFGDKAEQLAADRGIALETIQRMPLEMWIPPSVRSARPAARSTPSVRADHRRRSSDSPSPLAISSKPSAFTASTSARCVATSRFTLGAA